MDTVLCPNCMSPYVQPVDPGDGTNGPELGDERLHECTECEYVAPMSEFLPENYR